MPARHRTKQYSENSYYHIYNRGVEKRSIFLDEQDYGVFLSYLKDYLLPKNEQELSKKLLDPNTSYKEKGKILKRLKLKNFYDDITLLAYCLMPNHFHFLIKQKGANIIDKFMKSLAVRYSMYFNAKYKRVGKLCQDIYKAVIITTDEQFIYLTSYIHSQAIPNQPSSYLNYLGKMQSDWVHPEEIIAFFSKNNPKLTYQNFVEQTDDFSPIQSFVIDT